MPSQFEKAYTKFILELNQSKAIWGLFWSLIQKAKGSCSFRIEFTSRQSCLIKFPDYPVSLEISLSTWDFFSSSPSEKNSKVFQIVLLANHNRMVATSKYLDYQILKRKHFGTIPEVHQEITRVERLLKQSSAGTIWIDKVDEPWTDNNLAINPKTTLTRETFQAGFKQAHYLATEFEKELQRMSSQVEKNHQKLKQEIQELYDRELESFQASLEEKKKKKESKKKKKPILGTKVEKNIPEKNFSPPAKLKQTFYEVEIIPTTRYLLLAKFTNPENESVPTFYLALQNTPYNMITGVNQYGVEMLYLDQKLTEIKFPLDQVDTQMITTKEKILKIVQDLEKTFQIDMN